MKKPLVSIIIPAYNAEKLIGYTLESAVSQTWPRKEIIVVDDGSTDRTAEIARRFASRNLKVVSIANCGLSGAVNNAYKVCQGDYIQELDADDILSPDKIEKQLSALREGDSPRLLLSSPWAPFYFRTSRARFIHTPLCQDLSPVEWLLHKMGRNLHMQNATWLVSRDLAEAVGGWDESLRYDQDGEYFDRVVMMSDGTRFVPGTGVFYRMGPPSRVSNLNSDPKRDSMLRSMKLHVQYLRSLEDSKRVRKACVAYLQNWCGVFYSERPDIVAELEALAEQLGGRLKPPTFGWKYAWMARLLGAKTTRSVQRVVGESKSSCFRRVDKFLFELEARWRPAHGL